MSSSSSVPLNTLLQFIDDTCLKEEHDQHDLRKQPNTNTPSLLVLCIQVVAASHAASKELLPPMPAWLHVLILQQLADRGDDLDKLHLMRELCNPSSLTSLCELEDYLLRHKLIFCFEWLNSQRLPIADGVASSLTLLYEEARYCKGGCAKKRQGLLDSLIAVTTLFHDLAWYGWAEKIAQLAVKLHACMTEHAGTAAPALAIPATTITEAGAAAAGTAAAPPLPLPALQPLQIQQRYLLVRSVGLLQMEQRSFGRAAESFAACEVLAASYISASAPTDGAAAARSPPPLGSGINMALLLSDRSELEFTKTNYKEAWQLSVDALQSGVDGLSPLQLVKILRRASTVAVVKRKTAAAKRLIDAALSLSVSHQLVGEYADLLESYAHYLLNCDETSMSTTLLKRALAIVDRTHGKNNLKRATVLESLAYSLYVENYSAYEFDEALEVIEECLAIRIRVLDKVHFQVCSAKRVKALIIEENALKTLSGIPNEDLLDDALVLQLEGLELSKKELGENNLTTAKYYGNLGRLYQTRCDYQKSEEMHRRAIVIKESLLGPDDYEVALSVGHLASLFCYDMSEYDEAIALYTRSIRIGVRLFGVGYSGLEYDYRGLMHLFAKLEDWPRYQEFQQKLEHWHTLRVRKKAKENDGESKVIETLENVSEVAMVADFAALSLLSLSSNDTSDDAAAVEF